MSKKSSPNEQGLNRNPSAGRDTGAPLVSFADNAGYRFDGDSVELNAELSLPGALAKGLYALELWTSQEAPSDDLNETQPGSIRVARLALDLPTPLGPITHEVRAHIPAKIPLSGRSYFVTLKLVHEDKAGKTQALDQVRFPLVETFPAPCFAGHATCQIEGNAVVFEVDRIESARAQDNVSGTLSLELRTAPSAAELSEGRGLALATFSLAPLNGGYFIGPLLCRTSLERNPVPGQGHFLVLREYTGAGYATRDYREVNVPTSAPAVSPASADKAQADKAQADKAQADKAQADKAQADKAQGAAPLAANDIELKSAKTESSPAAEPRVLSINKATAEELATLEGITPKIAKEIVKSRPFEKLSDLVQIKGVGQKIVERLKGRVTL
jgi:competence ComEA-like helix-hairpin-helix protein